VAHWHTCLFGFVDVGMRSLKKRREGVREERHVTRNNAELLTSAMAAISNFISSSI
jgi:hypothetical protein